MSLVDHPSASTSSLTAAPSVIRSPAEARRKADRLADRRNERVTRSVKLASRFEELNKYLATAEKVSVALDQLNEQLFKQLLGLVQEKLTVALQEVLEQPLCFRAKADFKRGAATVEFSIERNGNEEDVMRGQGGSVANVLSVGLRMFALATLDETRHRRFLVLDEQDCWLRPDLVPRLVKIVHEAARALGFQVLMISHHETALFERYADRIYAFSMNVEGCVEARRVELETGMPDRDDAS